MDKVEVDGKKVKVTGAWHDSPWKIAGAAVTAVIGVALLALIALMFVVPRVMGGASLTVLTGSMEPTISAGDVIVVRGVNPNQACDDIRVGHIVTFFPEPGNPDLITHRVVGKSAGTFPDGTTCRFITRGDANTADDPPVSPEQIRGVFMYGIPRLGWARQWVGEQPQYLVIGAVALVIGYVAWTWLRPAKKTARVLTGAEAAAARASQAAAGGASGVSSTTVSAGATGVPAGYPSGGYGGGMQAQSPVAPSPEEMELRRRELAIREREIALREYELGLRSLGQQTPSAPADEPPSDAPVAETELPVQSEEHERGSQASEHQR